MPTTVKGAQVGRIFSRQNQHDSIIIDWKMTSWLLRCILIRYLVRRVNRASPPLLSTSRTLSRSSGPEFKKTIQL